MADLSTLFCGFNPKRVFNGYIFGGVGLNHAFDNDEANALDTRSHELEYLWQDKQNLVAGRMGLGCDLRLNDRLAINIEGNANVLSDKFNSKKAGNCDWQFNVLVGLNIKLGKSYKKTAPVYYEPEPIVEQPKPQPVVKQPEPEPVAVVVEPMKQNIFFALNSALLQKDQQSKIDEMCIRDRVEALRNSMQAAIDNKLDVTVHEAAVKALGAQIEGIETGLSNLANGAVKENTEAVSYTHLDVYKRQVPCR